MQVHEIDIVAYGFDLHTLDNFISINPDLIPVSWCDGYVFILNGIDLAKMTELLIDKKEMVFGSIAYAKLPDYEPVLYTSHMTGIPVANHSGTKMFQQIADYCKQQEITNSVLQ